MRFECKFLVEYFLIRMAHPFLYSPTDTSKVDARFIPRLCAEICHRSLCRFIILRSYTGRQILRGYEFHHYWQLRPIVFCFKCTFLCQGQVRKIVIVIPLLLLLFISWKEDIVEVENSKARQSVNTNVTICKNAECIPKGGRVTM